MEGLLQDKNQLGWNLGEIEKYILSHEEDSDDGDSDSDEDSGEDDSDEDSGEDDSDDDSGEGEEDSGKLSSNSALSIVCPLLLNS